MLFALREFRMAAVNLRYLLLLRKARIYRYLLWKNGKLSLLRKKQRPFLVRKIFAERQKKENIIHSLEISGFMTMKCFLNIFVCPQQVMRSFLAM